MTNLTDLTSKINKEELLEVLTRLLAQRSRFYAKVIMADLENLPTLQGSFTNQKKELKLVADKNQQSEIKQKIEPETVNLREKVREKVIELAAEKTGLTKEAINLEYRLLDDLNLDSIKAGSLMTELAKIYNLQGKFEASQFANATLGEIIEAIAFYLQDKEAKLQPETSSEPSWVRSFTVEVVATELENQSYVAEKKQTAVIFTKSHEKLAESLGELWNGQNTPDRLLVLIPETMENLTETVEMLTNVAKITAGKPCELGFIQFGDGYFARCQNNNAPVSVLSAVSFAASLHLERPTVKIRVLEFHRTLSFEIITQKVEAEFATTDYYCAAGYNSEAQRNQMVYELAEKKSQPRSINLSQDDVIIVTGGAKGITAECALALAQKYHCKMALVGSSPLGDEVRHTLKKYAEAQLTAAYYCCNITDQKAIASLIEAVTAELGVIIAVIHGAGTNKPRKSEQVSSTEAYQEISAKIIGAKNIIEALKSNNLKYFIAFTSIIGITGMPGNSWYAFANEVLDLLLRNLQKQTQTLTLAYSVWSEVGMGARMGSTQTLAKMGIEAIPPHVGVAEFLHWVENSTDDQQIVIAAKLGGLDTWKRKTYDFSLAYRYLEDIQYFEPGVELIVRSSLTRQHDRYTDDHNFNGSRLFATVFGLEAMTQAAACVTGITNINSVKLQNISLLRPIVVPEIGTIKIQIHALVEKNQVFAAISTEESNYQTPHFSAEITLNPSQEKQFKNLNLPAETLHLEPKTDLYSWLLFQGEIYQNIDKVYRLNSDKVVLSTKALATDTAEICFSDEKLTPFILGSPLLRDVLLQSGQIPLTQNVYLPINIEQWEIFKIKPMSESGINPPLPPLTKGGKMPSVVTPSPYQGEGKGGVFYSFGGLVECTITKVEEERAFADVVFINEENEISEKIVGYQVKSLKPTPEYPQPMEIREPSFIETKIIDGFQAYEQLLTDKPQLIVYKHSELFNELNRETRHQIEQQVFAEKYAAVNGIKHQITWLESGKPEIYNSDLQISIAHSRSLLLMTIGQTVQGCDLEFVATRTREEWSDLLGNQHIFLLDELKTVDNSIDVSATRLWCVKEAVIKAFGVLPETIKIELINGKGVVFESEVKGDRRVHILTFPVNIWPKNQLIVASLVQPLGLQVIERGLNIMQSQETEEQPKIDLINGKFVHKFKTTFKDCKGAYGKTYFTNFPVWMGQIRELGLNPVNHRILEDFQTGEYGMVTNASSIKIYNEAETLNNIVGKVLTTDKSDLEKSFIDLEFEWFKEEADGSLIKLADCYLSTTWVKIEGHGIVKPTPMPGYLYDMLLKIIEEGKTATKTQHQIKYISLLDLGEIKYESTAKPRPDILLSSQTYQTGIYDSNSVGNLYYSNYYDWQAKNIEKFIYQLMPAVFIARGKAGEYICLEAEVNHLQEAMPFEEIEVNMYLEKWYTNGCKLYFEYYSLSGGKRKLAYGHNILVWATRKDEKSIPVACELPIAIQNRFME